MKVFTVPGKSDVSPSNQMLFDKLYDTIGMVPNLYATIAYSDNGLGRYLTFQNGKSSFTAREKEAVSLVVSQVNGCRYCLSAHTYIGKLNGFLDDEMLRIRNGSSNDSKLSTLVALAKEITEHQRSINNEKLQAFYHAGYTNEHLVDLVLQISETIASNYLYRLTEVPVDFPLAPDL